MAEPYREATVPKPQPAKIIQIAVGEYRLIALDIEGCVWVSNMLANYKFSPWSPAIEDD